MRMALAATVFCVLVAVGCSSQRGEVLSDTFVIERDDLKYATLMTAGFGVEVHLTSRKGTEFQVFTRQNMGNTVQIYFEDTLVAEPRVVDVIEDGVIFIPRRSDIAARDLLKTFE